MTISLEFKHVNNSKSGITKIWNVEGNGYVLGEVKWWANWRRYCFFPAAGMLFDADCMQQITDFLHTENVKHKAAK